jgi:hypothetical protein
MSRMLFWPELLCIWQLASRVATNIAIARMDPINSKLYLTRSHLVLLALIVSIIAISGTGMGAALIVDGGASPAKAAAGNSESELILLSVTDQSGAAVRGLGPANFKIDATIVALGGALVDIKRASEASRAPGFYIIEIVPTTYRGTQYTWKAGGYLLAIAVEKGADRGQAVIELQV